MLRYLSSFSLRLLLPVVVASFVCLFACRQKEAPVSQKGINVTNGDTAAVRALLRSAQSIPDSTPGAALLLLDSVHRLSIAANDTWSTGMSRYYKAQLLFDTSGYLPGRELYVSALEALLAADSLENAANAATGIGNTFLQTGPPDSAVKAYMQALDLFAKANKPNSRAQTYSGLSTAFSQLGQREKCLEYSGKAEQLFRAANDTPNIIRSMINQATQLNYLYRYEASVPMYQRAIALSDRSGFVLGRFYGRLAMGDYYTTQFKYDSALIYLRAAEKVVAENTVAKQYMSILYATMGRVYYMQKVYAPARVYFGKALEISGQLGNLDMMIKQYRVFTKVNILLGLKDESIKTYDLYTDYRDSMQDIQVSASVNEMETKYRTAEKDAELARKELDLARQQLDIRNRNTGLFILSGILLLLLGGGGAYLMHARQKQQLAAQKILTLAREADLEKAKAAMDAEEKERARIARNLHDGAGSILSGVKLYLSSLENQYSELAGSNAYRDTLGLLNEAVSEIRETSHNLLPKILHLNGLHAAISGYCNKLERNERFELEFQSYGTPERYNHDFELMAFRTFQELISNVIKHADASHVLVQLTFRHGAFSITVEDDGKGMGTQQVSDGIGMFGIRSRVVAYKGTMDVDSSPEGTSVSLEFPVPAVQLA